MSGRVERLQTACPVGACDGSGWIVDENEVASACECRARRIAQARMRGVRSTIPRKYQGLSFERPPISDLERNAESRVVVRIVREFIEDIEVQIAEGRGLWIIGDVGTGKTSLAMLASMAAIQAGKTVAVYSLPQLLSRIRATYDSPETMGRYDSFFGRVTAVDLLQIDDLGAAYRTEWVLEQLYSIVDARYQQMKPLLVTVNIEPEDRQESKESRKDLLGSCVNRLERQIGERTVSRLVEICGDPLPLFGEDRRYRVA